MLQLTHNACVGLRDANDEGILVESPVVRILDVEQLRAPDVMGFTHIAFVWDGGVPAHVALGPAAARLVGDAEGQLHAGVVVALLHAERIQHATCTVRVDRVEVVYAEDDSFDAMPLLASGDSTAEVKEAQLRYMERRYLRLAHTLREVVHAMKFHHKGGIVSAVISALIELQKEAEAAGVYSTQ